MNRVGAAIAAFAILCAILVALCFQGCDRAESSQDSRLTFNNTGFGMADVWIVEDNETGCEFLLHWRGGLEFMPGTCDNPDMR